MSFTPIQSAFIVQDGSSPSIPITVAATGAGRLIRAGIKYEGPPRTLSCSDGTSTFEIVSTQVSHGNGDFHVQLFALRVSNAGKTSIVISSSDGDFVFARAWAYEDSYTAPTLEQGVNPTGGGASGTSAAPASGSVTEPSTDGIGLGVYGEYSEETLSSPLIGGVAADSSLTAVPGKATAWTRAFSSGFTAQLASAALTGSAEWICAALTIRAATGSTPKPTGPWPTFRPDLP